MSNIIRFNEPHLIYKVNNAGVSNGQIKEPLLDTWIKYFNDLGFVQNDEGKILRIVDHVLCDETYYNRAQILSISISYSDFLKEYAQEIQTITAFKNPYLFENIQRLSEIENKYSINNEYFISKNGYQIYVDYKDNTFNVERITKGFVYKSRTLDIEIKPSQIGKFSFNTNFDSSNIFERFVWNISGSNNYDFKYFMNALGYLCSNSNDRVAVLVMDTNEGNNGGTGKGTLTALLEWALNGVMIAGKKFDAKNTFAFQACTKSTRLVRIEDLKENMSIVDLYSDIGDGLEVNRKFEKSFKIFPKFCFTTNSAVKIEGHSDERRIHEIVLEAYYGKGQKQSIEGGVWLSNKDFNGFDLIKFLCKCLLQFNADNSKLLPRSLKSEAKRIEAIMPTEVRECLDLVVDELNTVSEPFIKAIQLNIKFREEARKNALYNYNLTTKKAGNIIHKYFELNGEAEYRTIKEFGTGKPIKVWFLNNKKEEEEIPF
jgi:hypothetical protein